MGSPDTGPDYLKAEQLRRMGMNDLVKVFADVDVIIRPTPASQTKWHIGEWTVRVSARIEEAGVAGGVLAARLSMEPGGAPGHLPALACCIIGLPIGLQLAAAPSTK